MDNFNSRLKTICFNKNNRLCLGLDVDNNNLKNSSLSYMKDYIIDVIESTVDWQYYINKLDKDLEKGYLYVEDKEL